MSTPRRRLTALEDWWWKNRSEAEALDTLESLFGREAREALEAATPDELAELVRVAKAELRKGK